MAGQRMRGAAVLLAAVLLGTPGMAGPAGAESLEAPGIGAADAYQKSYRMSADAARAAVAGENARHAFYAAMNAHAATFGGAWFDPPSGLVHVAVTADKAGREAVALATKFGVPVRTHLVARSFDELERLADRIRTGTDALSQAAQGNVGIDVPTNRVMVSLPQANRVSMSVLPPGVAISSEAAQKVSEDTCTNRADCDDTIMAGLYLSPRCSVGFTARGNGGRYVLTAGHCTTGNGVAWGVGGTDFGTMEASRNSGNVDVAIIRVDRAPYDTQGGGMIFCVGCVDRFFPIVGSLREMRTIVVGERVCLSANIPDAAGTNPCGTIRSAADSGRSGLTTVNGLDACGGESGGGWYWPADQGRFAYGIHKGSSDGCRVAGGQSWFTALPNIGTKFGFSLSVETR